MIFDPDTIFFSGSPGKFLETDRKEQKIYIYLLVDFEHAIDCFCFNDVVQQKAAYTKFCCALTQKDHYAELRLSWLSFILTHNQKKIPLYPA